MNPYPRRSRLISIAVGIAASIGGLAVAPAALAVPGVPPTADIAANPNPADVGETVNFDASGSTEDSPIAGAPITSYEWDFDGDGTVDETTAAATTTHVYPAAGTFDATVTVVDADGDRDQDSVTVRVNGPPTAGFIFEPSTPGAGETITFSSTSTDEEGPIADAQHRWDFDNDGVYGDKVGETVTHSFPAAGSYPVGLEVTDSDGATDVDTRIVEVQENPPSSVFTFTPPEPLTHETVEFDGSGSTDSSPGGSITSYAWDLDGDGEFDDGTGPQATFQYPNTGPRRVGLRVESVNGFDISTQTVRVRNRPPQAAFEVSPAAPNAGQRITLSSTSADPDGPLASQEWDLDGDGQFDDASGPTTETEFAEAGQVRIGLRVTDTEGASDTEEKSIEIATRPLRLMSPFPVVRLSGELRPGGATKVRRLAVRGEDGVDVFIRCRGKTCPFKKEIAEVDGKRVEIDRIEGSSLGPRTRLKIFVTDPGAIGKFTRFLVRPNKPPKRRDRCLEGEAKKPVRCPDT